jgi:signal peptidase II
MRRSWQVLAFLAVAATVTGCDQLTKLRAVEALASGARTIDVIQGFGRLAYVENPGASWSILHDAPDAWRTPLLVGLSVVGLIAIASWFRNSKTLFATVALALVFGGALGNLVDRLRLGYVVDFISVHWRDRAHFPVFNVADIAITCGALLLLTQVKERSPGEDHGRVA